MKSFVLFFTVLILSTSLKAQSVVGVWKTIDDATGKAKSHVKIYEVNGKYYGKVIKILDPSKQNAICSKCTGDKKDKKIVGLQIISGLVKDGTDYEDGTILDPKDGKVYDCTIWLAENGDLNVRGYVGFFFRTQTWKRIK